MKAKQLFMPLVFIALFFVSNVVKAQTIGIKMNAAPLTNSFFDPYGNDQHWEIDFYNTTTMETYVVYANPEDFNTNDNWETSSPLAQIPFGTYDISFYYQNQSGEYGNIDHTIYLGDMGSQDGPTSTSTALTFSGVTLDYSAENDGNSILFYVSKDY